MPIVPQQGQTIRFLSSNNRTFGKGALQFWHGSASLSAVLLEPRRIAMGFVPYKGSGRVTRLDFSSAMSANLLRKKASTPLPQSLRNTHVKEIGPREVGRLSLYKPWLVTEMRAAYRR